MDNNSYSEIGSVIYKLEPNKEENNTAEYLGKKGVWAMFGSKDSMYFYCLNVGKNVNIGKEVSIDVRWIKSEPQKQKGDKLYINYFGENCNFYYISGKTREYLYPYLKDQYPYLLFMLIYEGDSNLNIEKEFAVKTHSCFWRNGRPYNNAKSLLKMNVAKSIEQWISFTKSFGIK